MYHAALLLFEDVLRKLDLADGCTQKLLFTACPQNWTPPYNGVKPLILRGLGHPRTHAVCARLLLGTSNMRGVMLLDPTPHYTVLCLVAQVPLLLSELERERDRSRETRGVGGAGRQRSVERGEEEGGRDRSREGGREREDCGSCGSAAGMAKELAAACGARGLHAISQVSLSLSLSLYFSLSLSLYI
jgi:hypothetical protein